MNEADKNYELEIFRMIVNNYLDESTSCTESSLNELETKSDQITWDLASKIYRQSGHKVEFSLVRCIVNSRIKAIKYQLAEVEKTRRITESEVEKTRRITESDPQFFSKVADVLGEFRGDERKAKIFVRVQKVISDQLAVEESEVSLYSHLSNHLNADYDDLVELLMALEEEFGIGIPDEIAENSLGVVVPWFGGFSWGVSSF